MGGYHGIRGLAAPLRMMMYYKEKTFTNVSYGSDMGEAWFKNKKPELVQKNSCINLPYVIDGETVVTQSNTCMLYCGARLQIDKPRNMTRNHTVLDETMDLRNDIVPNVVYSFGACKTKEEFPAVAAKHFEGSMSTHFTKLEGFCVGPFMCGDEPESGDFHLFEMIEQHKIMGESLGQEQFLDKFPKLAALYAAFKALPTLQKYWESEFYSYPHNNPLGPTFFTGLGEGYVYPPTSEVKVEF